MSKKRQQRYEERLAQAESVPVLHAGDAERLMQELSMSGYFAAQASPIRGQLWWPTLDSRKSMDGYTRTELVKMSRALAENCGFAGGPLDTLSELVGWLKPQARTTDNDWNEEAERRFEEITGTAFQFDLAGKDNFASSQIRATKHRNMDGDFGTVFSRSEFGTTQILNYEGTQIGRARFPGAEKGWFDGVQIDRYGRAVRFSLLSPDGDADALIDSAVFHHHANRRFQNAVRGTPVLSPHLNDIVDITDIDGFTKHAIKIASLFALTRESQNGPQGITAPIQSAQLPTPLAAHPAAAPQTTATPTAATTTLQPIGNFESVFTSGMMSSVPLKAIHDDRPHPNAQAFKDYLLRKCANGIGCPAPILFLIDEPGGVWTRYLMERAADWILCQQIFHLLPYCRRVWNIVVATEMKAGRLRQCKDFNWWRPSAVKWVGKRKLTVDIGREGNLQIALKNAMMTTYSQWYDALGHEDDWQSAFDQAGRELAYGVEVEKKNGLTPGWITDRIRGVQQLPPETPMQANPAASAGPSQP